MALAESEKKIILAALGYAASADLKPSAKALLTRATGIVRREASHRYVPPPAAQLAFELSFRKLPPNLKRRGRGRWAKYDFALVEEARRLRYVKRWTYRDIAEMLNLRHGTKIPWITVRDWTVQAYRVTG